MATVLLWPTEEQVREFKRGKAPWPWESYPSERCKCGILATQDVVPSELGYGWFCGNAYGEYREGRTCDWEGFYGHHDLMLKLGRTSEPWKVGRNDVPILDSDLLWGKIYQDMIRETGVKPKGLYVLETLIKYWRWNRTKYPQPLIEDERREKRRKLQEERARTGFVVDPDAKYFKGSWEEYFQQVEVRKRRIEMEELQERAEEAQMETMKALVDELPVGMAFSKRDKELPQDMANVDKKGKGNFIAEDDDDGWDDDELLYEGDSN
ncbi:hypothetical protein SETIT_9G304700v2 [Setaria italica]|uniref:Uncharacterized protein n=1 Tax=Setaria italica TaxID=4555 RepID=A0A368SMC0_SETIT|nr:hypothetical protein SETIT_9G304700v2 [Setaria italica]